MREAWRIQDQSWQLDLLTDPNIPYPDVEKIVFAIRRGQLVNVPPAYLRLHPTIAAIPADAITNISRYKSEPSTYEVRTGHGAFGFVLQVKIVNDRVELQNVSSWMS